MMESSSKIPEIMGGQPSHESLSIAADLVRTAHNLEGLVLLDATLGNQHDSSHFVHDTIGEPPSRCKKLGVSIASEDHAPTRVTSTVSLERESLHLLTSHFPRGCVLKVGDRGVLALVITDTPRSGPALYENLYETIGIPLDLRLLLDRARSLIFVPLWDSARQAFCAAMLGWAVNPLHVFTEHDLLSLSIYGSILTAEITRLGMHHATCII